MKQRTICKTLAVAVILLFVGFGVQPAFAVTPNIFDNIKNIRDNNYQEYTPVIRIALLLFCIFVLDQIFFFLEELSHIPGFRMTYNVLLLIYALMVLRVFDLMDWDPPKQKNI